MKKRDVFLSGLLVVLLAMGLVLVGCSDDSSGDDGNKKKNSNNSSSNNNSNNNNSSNEQGGNDNSGSTNSGGTDNSGSNSGGTNSGSQDSGGNTFTPPKKADIETFVENYRKDTKLMGESAAVYIKSITINTYTVDGNNITTNPSPVPENAQVQVKFTVRTILSFNNLTMGERLNIDNFRVDLQSALQTWLKNQGFGSSNIKVTTGDTVFG